MFFGEIKMTPIDEWKHPKFELFKIFLRDVLEFLTGI